MKIGKLADISLEVSQNTLLWCFEVKKTAFKVVVELGPITFYLTEEVEVKVKKSLIIYWAYVADSLYPTQCGAMTAEEARNCLIDLLEKRSIWERLKQIWGRYVNEKRQA